MSSGLVHLGLSYTLLKYVSGYLGDQNRPIASFFTVLGKNCLFPQDSPKKWLSSTVIQR